jgi:hypothetical protein
LLHPELPGALQRGKLPADGEAARRLHQRATGFSCKTTKLFYDQKHNKIIEHEIEEYYPPHVGARAIRYKIYAVENWMNLSAA